MRPFLVVLALAGTISAAQAQTIQDDRYPSWGNRMQGYQAAREWRWEARRAGRRKVGRGAGKASAAHGEVIGGRPSGCPHRFCGCALSLRIFGRIVPTLNLAANWLTFPRAAPAPGMVAARRGHVFQLLAHRTGSSWQVWDANSGRGRIRVHERSIAGYAIVNPSGRSLSARKHPHRYRGR